MRGTKLLACSSLLIVGLGCTAKDDQDEPAPPGVGVAGSQAIGAGGALVPGGAVQPPGSAVTPPGGGPITGPVAGTQSPSGTAGSAAPPGADEPPPLGEATSEPIPENCQAFPLMGIKYSPGGDVPPNKCAAFHHMFNNPFAIRCIDAIPGYDTGYPGDEFCILPPPPEKGIQVGVYAHGDSDTYWGKMWSGDFMAGYMNPPAEFVLPKDGEVTQNYLGHGTNTVEKNYYRTYFRMRTGSHHNIITLHDGTMPDQWLPNTLGADALPGLFGSPAGTVIGILGGQQRPDDSTPVTFEKPAEDKGLYLKWPETPAIVFNMHHFNITDGPILREGWSNIWWEDDATQLVSWFMGLEFGQVLALSVPPGDTQDLHYFWTIDRDVRVLRLFGHRHAWTSNFTSWVERAGGEGPELIYQSYDWEDMPTYRYDSAVKNPPLDPMNKLDGAVSGVLELKAGDELHFNCHIEFTNERAAKVPEAPTPTEVGTLRFANQAFHGEMCIQFGNVTGAGLGPVGAATTPPPDFATQAR